jgi:hypothetical protein
VRFHVVPLTVISDVIGSAPTRCSSAGLMLCKIGKHPEVAKESNMEGITRRMAHGSSKVRLAKLLRCVELDTTLQFAAVTAQPLSKRRPLLWLTLLAPGNLAHRLAVAAATASQAPAQPELTIRLLPRSKNLDFCKILTRALSGNPIHVGSGSYLLLAFSVYGLSP